MITSHAQLVVQLAELLLNARLHTLPRLLVCSNTCQCLLNTPCQLDGWVCRKLNFLRLQIVASFREQSFFCKNPETTNSFVASRFMRCQISFRALLVSRNHRISDFQVAH